MTINVPLSPGPSPSFLPYLLQMLAKEYSELTSTPHAICVPGQAAYKIFKHEFLKN